jgi:uncharacterized protein (DUF4415 family)
MPKASTSRPKELDAIERMRDGAIDTSDIPAAADWGKAVVGKFYRPIKKPLTIRLDADVLAWLKSQGRGYQTRVSALLRGAMQKHSTGLARR